MYRYSQLSALTDSLKSGQFNSTYENFLQFPFLPHSLPHSLKMFTLSRRHATTTSVSSPKVRELFCFAVAMCIIFLFFPISAFVVCLTGEMMHGPASFWARTGGLLVRKVSGLSPVKLPLVS